MSKSKQNARQKSAGITDPTVNLAAASTSNTGLPNVGTTRCHCQMPHRGHESVSEQMNSMRLAEATSDDSTSTPPSLSIPLSDTLRTQSSSNGATSTRQDRRNEQAGLEIKDLREELCTQCFFSSFFPGFNDEACRENINSLPLLAEGRFKLTSPSPEIAATRVAWPSSSLAKEFYSPLAELFNEIIDHVNGTPNLSHDKNVRFIPYGRPIAPVTPASLKPDMLLVETTASQLDHCRWEHPIISLGVKRDFWEGLKQLATYVREMLRARPGRQFAGAFTSTTQKQAFDWSSSPPTECTTPNIALSPTRQNLLTIGEDLSRDSVTKLLPNGDKLKIEAVEFDRKSIVGRKTRILSVTVAENIFTQAPMSPYPTAVPPSSSMQLRPRSVVTFPSLEQDMGARRNFDTSSSGQPTLRESPSDLPLSYHLKEIQVNPDERITCANDTDRLKLGDSLVIKESWPVVSRSDIEWDALKTCSRQFGVPEVIYRVIGRHPKSVVCTREPRVPHHIALREKGHRLQEARSPRILLTAVLHAVIGHWNFFREGWLHRDVSIGNVLMLVDPVTKTPPTGLKGLGELTECHGMLIDGDAMINVSSDREPGVHRSCTLPFLSRRLVDAWRFEIETFDQYFDDLESFTWVLLWALLEIAEANGSATPFDQALMDYLIATDLPGLGAGKDSIARQLKDLARLIGSPKQKPTSLLDPFIEILHHWLTLTSENEDHDDVETLSSNEESAALYEAFVTFAMEKMPDLPEEWPFANGNSLDPSSH